MKRYAVFVYEFYYPAGGWDDFRGDYDTLEEAVKHQGVTQVVDLQTGKVVYGDDDK